MTSKILALKEQGKSLREIARILGIHPEIVRRKLKKAVTGVTPDVSQATVSGVTGVTPDVSQVTVSDAVTGVTPEVSQATVSGVTGVTPEVSQVTVTSTESPLKIGGNQQGGNQGSIGVDRGKFHPLHWEDLKKSGLSDETIGKAGIYSCPPNELPKLLGWDPKKVESGLVFPYPAKDGVVRVKVWPSYKDKDGHTIKYLQPKNSAVHLYTPPGVEDSLKCTTLPLYWTEGEKKALRLWQEEILCVGLGGLWNWMEKGLPIQDMGKIAHAEREEIIVPDSDFLANENLLQAVYALGRELEDRGAKVKVIVIPQKNADKVGVDDLPLGKVEKLLAKYKTIDLKDKAFGKVRQWHKGWQRKGLAKGAELPEWLGIGVHGIEFRPGVLARYLTNNDHVFYAEETFFHYQGGVYKPISDLKAGEIVKKYLPDKYCKSAWISDTLNLWKMNIQKDEKDLNTKTDRIINLRNGLYHILEQKLIPHTPDYLFTIQLNARYDPKATCPRFLQFLREILPPENVTLVQEIVGYCMQPLTQAQRAFIFEGAGNTGKSTLLYVIEQLLGKSNVSHISFQDLSERFKVAELYNKLANIFADLPSRNIKDPGIFKLITGEDTLMGERKFKPPFSFRPYARLLFSCNRMARSSDSSNAFYRRLIIIPFNKIVPKEKIDRALKYKLCEELDGIFIWALQGLKKLMSNDFDFTENLSTYETLEQYKIENNPVLAFVQDMCELNLDSGVGKQELYEAFVKYCKDGNLKSMTQQTFNKELTTNFPNLWEKQIGPTRVKSWQGLKLIMGESNGKEKGSET